MIRNTAIGAAAATVLATSAFASAGTDSLRAGGSGDPLGSLIAWVSGTGSGTGTGTGTSTGTKRIRVYSEDQGKWIYQIVPKGTVVPYTRVYQSSRSAYQDSLNTMAQSMGYSGAYVNSTGHISYYFLDGEDRSRDIVHVPDWMMEQWRRDFEAAQH